MWRKDGTKLSGCYGSWCSQEFEMNSYGADRGKLILVQDGGISPGPEWRETITPERFARTPVRYSLNVPEAEVSEIHVIDVRGSIDQVRVRLLAEDENGRLAVESVEGTPPNFRDDLTQKYGLEYYDDRRTFAFGWVPAEDVHDITVERRDLTKD